MRLLLQTGFLLLCLHNISGLFNGGNTETLKSKILNLAQRTNRGLKETTEDKKEMENLFIQLEKLNKIKKSLSSPLINAVWELQYTTSDSILGRNGSPRVGPILQIIDAPKGFAKNSETIEYFGFLKVPRSVTAAISPLTSSKCLVQFKQFQIGPVPINCPPSFRGELDITYIDKNFRLSRGDKGNIFVLTKYRELP